MTDAPQQPIQAVVERAVLNATEVGRMIGAGRASVYGLHARGEMPAPIRVGRGLRWAKAEIEAWLLHGAPPRAAWERTWPKIRREILSR